MRITVLLLFTFSAACASAQTNSSPSNRQHAEQEQISVPAVAPDTIPAWVYAEANIERDSPLMTGEFVRNVFLLAFRHNTPQAVRQRIIDGVGGRVVGGRHIANGDGFYAVMIEDDGTAGPLLRIVNALQALPEVWIALPEFVDGFLSPASAQMRTKPAPGSEPPMEQGQASVPPVAPDTIPAWVYAEGNIERNSPLVAGEFVRNLVLVAFRENTPQALRQRIIEQIGGRVVGGRHIAKGDGFYAVLIKDDGTAGPLLHAIEQLDAMPEVWTARREFIRSGVSIR